MNPAASATATLATSSGVSPFARASRAYWLCQLFGWGAWALLNIALVVRSAPGQLGGFAVVFSWGAVTSIALSHMWRRILTQRGWLAPARRTPWARMLGGVLALGIVQTAVVALAMAVLLPAGTLHLAGLPGATFVWTLIFLIWSTLYATVSSMRGARRLESEALHLQILAKDAELRALKAQVNPHFFFNSLNSLRALVYENQDAAARMIDQLAGAMRYALRSESDATVSLGSEIEAVKAYLAIEKIRFEERLRSSITIETGLDSAVIPPMALQTLVENAVKYGVERCITGSEIRIVAQRDGARVRIEVANQGEVARLSDSPQIGFENTRKRLQLLLGSEATLELFTRDGWVVATLSLPGNP